VEQKGEDRMTFEELLLRFARRLVIVGSIMVFLGMLAFLLS